MLENEVQMQHQCHSKQENFEVRLFFREVDSIFNSSSSKIIELAYGNQNAGEHISYIIELNEIAPAFCDNLEDFL